MITIFSPTISWEEYVNKADKPIRYKMLAGKVPVATLYRSKGGKQWYCHEELPGIKLRKEFWPLDALMSELTVAVLSWFSDAMEGCFVEIDPHLNDDVGDAASLIGGGQS